MLMADGSFILLNPNAVTSSVYLSCFRPILPIFILMPLFFSHKTIYLLSDTDLYLVRTLSDKSLSAG